MLVVSDVHGAFGALAAVVGRGEPVAVLGDLINLIDYRTHDGLLADVVGRDLVAQMVELRVTDPQGARAAWRTAQEDRGVDLRSALGSAMVESYRSMAAALGGIERADVEVIHGNVDDPDLLRSHLPAGVRWAQGTTRTVDGEVFGFVGGGIPRIGTAGEVSDDEMAALLDALGPVDVLCTHVPPALTMLSDDVIGGTGKGSLPVLDYLDRHRPRIHYFGDVHQPRAVRMRHGATDCINVGYFRATGQPWRHRGPGS